MPRALLPPLRRQGVRKAACEPLARGLTNAIELCSMAGRVGEGCLSNQPEPWATPPNLPLPSQGEELSKGWRPPPLLRTRNAPDLGMALHSPRYKAVYRRKN